MRHCMQRTLKAEGIQTGFPSLFAFRQMDVIQGINEYEKINNSHKDTSSCSDCVYLGLYLFLPEHCDKVCRDLYVSGLQKLDRGSVPDPGDPRFRQDSSEADGELSAPTTGQQKRALWIAGAASGAVLCMASAFQQTGIATTTTAKASFITAM